MPAARSWWRHNWLIWYSKKGHRKGRNPSMCLFTVPSAITQRSMAGISFIKLRRELFTPYPKINYSKYCHHRDARASCLSFAVVNGEWLWFGLFSTTGSRDQSPTTASAADHELPWRRWWVSRYHCRLTYCCAV